MGPEFQYPPQIELFYVYQFDRAQIARGGDHTDRTIVRLRPGVTVEQAQA